MIALLIAKAKTAELRAMQAAERIAKEAEEAAVRIQRAVEFAADVVKAEVRKAHRQAGQTAITNATAAEAMAKEERKEVVAIAADKDAKNRLRKTPVIPQFLALNPILKNPTGSARSRDTRNSSRGDDNDSLNRNDARSVPAEDSKGTTCVPSVHDEDQTVRTWSARERILWQKFEAVAEKAVKEQRAA